MTKPVQIIVQENKVCVAGQQFAFSSQAAAQQAQCTLREPNHVPRGGNKFDKFDTVVFDYLRTVYDEATK